MEIEQNPYSLKNIVLFGLSGSGKDTIANELEVQADYFKIRIAGTIKQIIQEKHNFSENELEEAKRTRPEIREEHHIIGNYLDSFNATINRVKMIINGKVTDFKYKQDYQAVVVCDGRGLEREVKLFLEQPDWVCIFLSRNNYDTEYKNDNHWTEAGSIENSLKFIEENKFHEKSIIIINNKKEYKLSDEYNKIAEKCLGYFNISKNSSSSNLLNIIKHCITEELI